MFLPVFPDHGQGMESVLAVLRGSGIAGREMPGNGLSLFAVREQSRQWQRNAQGKTGVYPSAAGDAKIRASV